MVKAFMKRKMRAAAGGARKRPTAAKAKEEEQEVDAEVPEETEQAHASAQSGENSKNETAASEESKQDSSSTRPPAQSQEDGSSSNNKIALVLEAAQSVVEEDDPLLYPKEEELKSIKSERSKNALRTWYTRVRELVQYKQQHGDTMVPQKYPENKALGIWVNKQRMEYKRYEKGLKSSITPSKINVLNGIPFEWGTSKGEESWNERYAQLVEYHRQNGHCKVATKGKDNPGLGRWVTTQRYQYKRWKDGEQGTHMNEEREKKLEALGFQWKAQMKTDPPTGVIPAIETTRTESDDMPPPATDAQPKENNDVVPAGVGVEV